MFEKEQGDRHTKKGRAFCITIVLSHDGGGMRRERLRRARMTRWNASEHEELPNEIFCHCDAAIEFPGRRRRPAVCGMS